jgi:hypothetical protein
LDIYWNIITEAQGQYIGFPFHGLDAL